MLVWLWIVGSVLALWDLCLGEGQSHLRDAYTEAAAS